MTTVNPGDTVRLNTDEVVVRRNLRSKSQPCTCIHCGFGENMLRDKQTLAPDLASHVFGDLVSAEVVARFVLTAFIVGGVVEVYRGLVRRAEQSANAPLNPRSNGDLPDVRRAIQQAVQATEDHGCFRLRPRETSRESPAPSDDQEKEERTYSFQWRIFPEDPSNPDDLVSFLNEITDRSLRALKPSLIQSLPYQHRLVAVDKGRFVSMSYNPTQNVKTPDFLLLPIEAFSGEDFDAVDEGYINYSLARLVGESNKNIRQGLDRMELHSNGLRCAQPWIYSSLSLTISLDKEQLFFSRLDPCGWEHLALLLWDGRGCIELIRILLGLALSSDIKLGQNPDVALTSVVHTVQIQPRGLPSDVGSSPASSESGSDDESDDVVSVTPSHSDQGVAFEIPFPA